MLNLSYLLSSNAHSSSSSSSNQQQIAVDCSRLQQVTWPPTTNSTPPNRVNNGQPTGIPYHITHHSQSNPLPKILGQHLYWSMKSFVLMQIWISCQNPGFWLVQTEIIAFCQPIRRLPTVQGYSLPTHRETASPWPWHLQISGQKSWNRSRQCFFTSNWDS